MVKATNINVVFVFAKRCYLLNYSNNVHCGRTNNMTISRPAATGREKSDVCNTAHLLIGWRFARLTRPLGSINHKDLFQHDCLLNRCKQCADKITN